MSEAAAGGGNERQIAYWNEVAGPKWIGLQAAMEARLTGVEDRLLELAAPRPGERVLEIGCGTGTTTARLAGLVGEGGHVTAVDVSRPMLEAAQARLGDLAQVTLLEADAAVATFAAPFDLMTSRFGIMFFEDSAAAFANLRRALVPGGRLVCAAWGAIEDNPHWSVPLGIAIERLGPPKPRRPHAPGPLAFSDRAHVCAVLAAAGFADVAVAPERVDLYGNSLDDEARMAATMGPAGALIDERQADPAMRGALVAAFRAALPGYAGPDARLAATIHLITARNPG
ncbi:MULTISPECIES: class I SAM-dependent methyltransferase [unclassified Acidiphilium]|uniref:class I SAM-dependent methyltransferase n=1 Tax=unclassified Acidiphilium TaxID=2617493 RepID=UPI000BD8DE65|nr:MULTISPECIES: class I SAM-dependent methyltransferase [unclassified Acidiphilium]OYV55608.1 MAG: methyltransferase type 11 [Acidiphilium sp. 20-67-58]HQT60196.1 methyltransferase domain-containing protein [Acidiphilium sp.]